METEQINFLPEQQSQPENLNEKPSKRGIFLILGLAIILGLTVYSYTSGRDNAQNQKAVSYDSVTLEPKKPKNLLQKLHYIVFNKNQKQLAGEKKDRINVLLLGIGGAGHDGPYLSDTILLASIKPSTKQIALISIPRDLAVNIPGYGVQKVNHADAYGEMKQANWGGAFATEIISKSLNTDIPYYIRVDFTAFEEIIDEAGGIKIDVERTFVDTMYPAPNSLYQTVYFKRGITNMDGETALKFARSRHGDNGEGSDFARSKRQQKILVALKDKMLSYSTLLNPIKINNIINSLESHITTNLDFPEMMSLFKMVREMNAGNTISMTLDDSPNGRLASTFSYAGAFLLIPKTGDFGQISDDIKNIFSNGNADRYDAPEQDAPPMNYSAKVEIQNGTWNAGLAARLKKRLNNKSIQIETIGNSMSKPIEKSGIYQVRQSSENSALIREIVKELQIPSIDAKIENIKTAANTDVLIIIGEDFVD